MINLDSKIITSIPMQTLKDYDQPGLEDYSMKTYAQYAGFERP